MASSLATVGLTRMRELADLLPDHLRDGFAAGRQLELEVVPELRQVAVFGMGGSAIAGDLLAGLTDVETERSLSVFRSAEVPRPVDGRWLALCTSYSGDTWETLAAYDELGRRGAHRVVISSGGLLSQRAADDGTPCLVLPPGLPPRAAVGYVLGGLLGLTDPIFPESNESRVADTVAQLARIVKALGAPRGAPTTVAKQIGPRTPLAYAESGWTAVARRWKTQVEENAKRLAGFDVMPELFHNAIVPWDAIDRRSAGGWCVLTIEWSQQEPRIGARFRYLERLLRARGVRCQRVSLRSKDRLTAILEGVAFGDHLSLALARSDGVDPSRVDAITRMKKSLAGR